MRQSSQCLTRPLRVLIVDDYPDTTETLARLLTAWDYLPVTASTGLEALERARSFDPDVIIADVAMTGLSGLQLARKIRNMPESRDTVLIAITGVQGIEQECKEAGFDHYFRKPSDLVELQTLLEGLDHRLASLNEIYHG